jgi:hypothetical protein
MVCFKTLVKKTGNDNDPRRRGYMMPDAFQDDVKVHTNVGRFVPLAHWLINRHGIGYLKRMPNSEIFVNTELTLCMMLQFAAFPDYPQNGRMGLIKNIASIIKTDPQKLLNDPELPI